MVVCMIEWDTVKIYPKQVRDYSGRKRINITKSDGLAADDDVVVIRKSDYDTLIADYDRLLQMEKNVPDEEDLNRMVINDSVIEPIKSSYNDIIDGLKQDLLDKEREINRLKAVYQDYDKKVYSLGLLDILKHENRKISDDFNSKIWITRQDNVVTDTEVMKFPEPADSGGDNNPEEPDDNLD